MPDTGEIELAIRGGTIVDGTGGQPRRADLGIRNGRIAIIADTVHGRREIDASGRLVVPGFLDIHTHYDPQVLWDRALTPSSWHGVTSVVAGNCGYSIAPNRPEGRLLLLQTLEVIEDMRLATMEAGVEWDFETYPEYLEAIHRRGPVINFGGYVGHTAVRLYVMGDAGYERPATDDEIARMKQVVAESIRGGALGFSTNRAGFHVGAGGRQVPSIIASQEEVEALMRVPGEIGQGIVHIAPGENFAWLYEFQQSLGCKINWSSLITYPPEFKSRANFRTKLERHLEGRRAGADVWVQVSCRPITQEIVFSDPGPFSTVPSFQEFLSRPRADRPQLYADQSWRAKAWSELQSGKWATARWELVTISHSEAHPELVGRTVSEIAQERGCTALDAALDVALTEDLKTRFSVVFANDDKEALAQLMTSDGCIMGLSDAGAHISQICDAVMPTDFLSTWVRDRGVMPIAEGVRKLTGEIADLLGIDRGYLRVGAPADIVVLDLEHLSPGPIRRVYDMPAAGERLIADTPTGVDHVLVNGVPIRSEGQPAIDQLDTLPGTILRSRPAA